MRNRHFPRLCRACEAPMARQEDTCWDCGAPWDRRLATGSALHVIPGGLAEHPDGGHQPLTPATVTSEAHAVAQAEHDVDRWADEGGQVAAEPGPRTATPTIALS